MRAPLILALVMLASVPPASVMLAEPSRDAAQEASQTNPLPKIAPAPGFTLTSQDGTQISLANLGGQVVAVVALLTLRTWLKSRR